MLRRGVAYQGQNDLQKAKHDLEQVLAREPTNKRAQSLLSEVESAIEKEKSSAPEEKKKGRRMVIEEVEGSSDEEEENREPAKQEAVSKGV